MRRWQVTGRLQRWEPRRPRASPRRGRWPGISSRSRRPIERRRGERSHSKAHSHFAQGDLPRIERARLRDDEQTPVTQSRPIESLLVQTRVIAPPSRPIFVLWSCCELLRARTGGARRGPLGSHGGWTSRKRAGGRSAQGDGGVGRRRDGAIGVRARRAPGRRIVGRPVGAAPETGSWGAGCPHALPYLLTPARTPGRPLAYLTLHAG